MSILHLLCQDRATMAVHHRAFCARKGLAATHLLASRCAVPCCCRWHDAAACTSDSSCSGAEGREAAQQPRSEGHATAIAFPHASQAVSSRRQSDRCPGDTEQVPQEGRGRGGAPKVGVCGEVAYLQQCEHDKASSGTEAGFGRFLHPKFMPSSSNPTRQHRLICLLAFDVVVSPHIVVHSTFRPPPGRLRGHVQHHQHPRGHRHPRRFGMHQMLRHQP